MGKERAIAHGAAHMITTEAGKEVFQWKEGR